MAWTPLKTNYTNARWSGKKKFKQINNSDGTISFEDMTSYEAKENSFFGATDANQMNSAINDIMEVPLYIDGAGAHNSIYRGKKLGTSVSSTEYGYIADGSFKDLYIGDYWEINGTKYRIAAFDYYLNKGDTAMTEHHAVIVPDTVFGTGTMNSSHTAEGAYVGSQMYKTGLASAKSKIKTDFGSSHVLIHRNIFNNSVENGYPVTSAWCDSQVDLMNSINVVGSLVFTPVANSGSFIDNSTIDCTIFPLFLFAPSYIISDESYWLRDTARTNQFNYITNRGTAGSSRGGNSYGIRPSFCIG